MLNINELKVEDEIGYKEFIHIEGSKYFRYPIVDKYTVTEITPESIKINKASSSGVTKTVEKSGFSNLCELTEQAAKESAIAKLYEETCFMRYELEHFNSDCSLQVTLDNLADEDIEKVYELVKYLHKKYVTKE